ncbi:MAG: hypothetical protein HZC49_06320 [Nitrospirae bacterium]|nr:hypothetical protein [Nitrospirota bacterium]
MKTAMKFDINSDTLNKTDRCRDNYSCLTGEGKCLCEVESHFDKNILFIKTPKILCNYYMSFGYSHICKCPARKEIFYRYNQ